VSAGKSQRGANDIRFFATAAAHCGRGDDASRLRTSKARRFHPGSNALDGRGPREPGFTNRDALTCDASTSVHPEGWGGPLKAQGQWDDRAGAPGARAAGGATGGGITARCVSARSSRVRLPRPPRSIVSRRAGRRRPPRRESSSGTTRQATFLTKASAEPDARRRQQWCAVQRVVRGSRKSDVGAPATTRCRCWENGRAGNTKPGGDPPVRCNAGETPVDGVRRWSGAPHHGARGAAVPHFMAPHAPRCTSRWLPCHVVSRCRTVRGTSQGDRVRRRRANNHTIPCP
jgi:hypothetical protein